MTEFTLQALHDEIEVDPEGLDYKNPDTTWKGDDVIADLINDKTTGLVVDVVSVPMEQVRGTTTYEAYNNLLADKQEWLIWMTPNGGDFQVSADMKLQLSGRTLASNGVGGTGLDSDSFWAVADDQDMAPAMLVLIEVPGGRGEVLWGHGKTVSISEVSRAANV